MQELKSQRKQLGLNCRNDNQVQLLCCSLGCNFSALICRHKDCQCLPQNHRNCQLIYAEAIYQNVINKKKDLPPSIQAAVDKVQDVYNQAIEKLSRDRQSLISWKQNFGLSGDEIVFLDLVNRNCYNQLTGKLIHKIKKEIQNTPQFQWLTQDWATNFWKNQKVNFNTLFSRLNQFHNSSNSLRVMEKLPALPSVIQRESEKIIQFLGRPVNKFNLLYRASQNNFQVTKFVQKCGSKKNTLTIILTEHDKIIGGFNSDAWTQSFDPFQDLLGAPNFPKSRDEEFIFSLTQKRKYHPIMKEPSKFIAYSKQNGPTFGGKLIEQNNARNFYDFNRDRSLFDIKICDKANINAQSCFQFPITFNDGVTYKSQQTSKKFCGSSEKKCLIKQWQVFEVDFDL